MQTVCIIGAITSDPSSSYLTVNYETRKFSVSQARHDPDELSNIVAIPSAQATGTESEPTDPGSVPRPPYTVVTPTAEKSRALGTPAIAGIAVAVVVLALLTGGIVLWVCRRKRKARALRDKAERPFDHPAPHDARELDGSGRPDPRKAGPDVTVAEKEQSRIDQREVLLMDHGNNRPVVELASPELLPSELPSHGTANRFELPSSEPVHRSELSTPEPVARSELSTPEPEWPASFEREDGTVGEPSPPLGMDLSPISAPGSLWSGNRRRQPHLRMNSSESDGGWPRAGTPPSSPPSSRPPLRHSRMISSDSESSFHPDRASSGSLRPTQVRMDSSDSEVGVKRATFSSVRRPHRRLDSNDSDTTMDARLALNSSISFSPPQPSHDRHVQGIPSLGPEPSLFSLSSPSLESMKSGLVSPTPLEDVDEGEARDYPNPEWRRGNRG